MTNDDRQRFHELLDWMIDHDENFAIAQYARMDLEYQIHRTVYRLKLKKTEEDDES